jgi:hydroxymethylbilane synthase
LTRLRLGTRGSQLALWQARTVADRLATFGVATCEIVVIKTSGDRLSEANLSAIGGKRLFVKEIEDALLGGTVDIAVHSAKDMPAVLPPGLAIAAVLEREDPRDAVVLPAGPTGGRDDGVPLVEWLRSVRRIGTSSIRRTAQLRRALPAATFLPVRGNLDTRLRKLDEGQFDAIVLATAGLKRLGFSERISVRLPLDVCVPAPGQGIVAIETRGDDDRALAAVGAVSDGPSFQALLAERALVEALGGGCQMPIGAIAIRDGEQLVLSAVVVAPDGTTLVSAADRDHPASATSLGRRVAGRLLDEGAAAILDAVSGPSPSASREGD